MLFRIIFNIRYRALFLRSFLSARYFFVSKSTIQIIPSHLGLRQNFAKRRPLLIPIFDQLSSFLWPASPPNKPYKELSENGNRATLFSSLSFLSMSWLSPRRTPRSSAPSNWRFHLPIHAVSLGVPPSNNILIAVPCSTALVRYYDRQPCRSRLRRDLRASPRFSLQNRSS